MTTSNPRGPSRRPRGWIRPLLAALVAAVAVQGTGHAQDEPPNGRTLVRMGVIVDGSLDPTGRLVGPAVHTRTLDMIRQEILALTREGFDVRFPDGKILEAGWSIEAIRAGLESLLADQDVDMVLTMGVFSTHMACQMRDLSKPVIAPFGVEPEVQQLPLDGEGSGVRNLSYLTVPTNFVKDMEVFRRLIGFETVHVMHDSITAQVIDHMYERVIALGRQVGFEAIPLPVEASAEEALAALPPDTQAVYMVPLLRMSQDELQRVIDGLKARKIPSFSIMGREDVRRGILATSSPGTNLERLARRVGLTVHRILLGEEPGKVPVKMEGVRRLAINMETAEAIGWYPDWRTALEAELIGLDVVTAGRTLSLTDAVVEAVASNLDLKAASRSVAAGRENIRTARSALLPNVDFSASALQIDEDRAESSLGAQPERSVTGTLELTQTLYSDGARANLDIQRDVQAARELDLHSVRLDIALAASTAFLEMLRAQTLARIEESNLRLTESNLQLARRRQAVGVTGPAEVYRWESELAAGKARVLLAQAGRLTARAALNRLLNRPQEERVDPVVPSLESVGLMGADNRLQGHVGNERDFNVFREFIVSEGMRDAPELKALDAQIDAQERILLAARRAYWSPDVLLRGELNERVSESGEGTDGFSLPAPFPSGTLNEPDDTTWSVGLFLEIPLFTSGARSAEVSRTTETLAELRLDRASAAEKIEQRIRTAVYAAGATWPNIELSREAAEASNKNLDLVTDMYAQGVVSIIDLLDAQNAALVSRQFSANAVFDFFIDLMEVQRAASNFEFFSSAEKREAWFGRLQGFASSWDAESESEGDDP